MRIAIDARMGDTCGGIGVYIRELLSYLADIDKKNKYFVIVNKQRDGNFVPSADNFTILVSSITRKHYFIKDLWNPFFLLFLLKANNIDVYFNPRYVLPFFKGNIKMMVTMHDMIAFLYPEIWPGISSFRIRNYIKHFSKRADIIITISSWVKKDIVRILNVPKDKVKVIYCGINKKLFKPKIKQLLYMKNYQRTF